MSRLPSLLEPLRQDVRSSKYAALWQEAQRRHPTLKKYDSPGAVIDFLNDVKIRRFALKDLLTQVLIAEHKQRRASFWTSVLLAAYYPMLLTLRCRIRGQGMSPEDLDQLVITAFLTALDELVLTQKRNRTALLLRRNTARSVFGALRQGQKELEQKRALTKLLKDQDGILPLSDQKTSFSELNTSDVARLMLEISHGIIPRDRVEVVIATYLHGEPLKDYVHRTELCEPGQDPTRTYQRIKRERLRTIERLGDLLEGYCCPLVQDQDLYQSDEDESFPNRAIDSWTSEVFQ